MLIEKYRFKPSEAELLNDFMIPMLEFRPEKRITADKCLKHDWLNEGSSEYKMSDEDYQNYINESEQKRVEIIERYERDGYASSPEVPQEYSADEGDLEDNSSSGSWFSDQEPNETLNIKEEDYHSSFKIH